MYFSNKMMFLEPLQVFVNEFLKPLVLLTPIFPLACNIFLKHRFFAVVATVRVYDSQCL